MKELALKIITAYVRMVVTAVTYVYLKVHAAVTWFVFTVDKRLQELL
jgi:hypothetical protein